MGHANSCNSGRNRPNSAESGPMLAEMAPKPAEFVRMLARCAKLGEQLDECQLGLNQPNLGAKCRANSANIGDLGPDSSNFGTEFGQSGAESYQLPPPRDPQHVARLQPSSTKLGQASAKIRLKFAHQIRLDFDSINIGPNILNRPTSARNGPRLAGVDQHLAPEVCVNAGPVSVSSGPTLTKFDQHWRGYRHIRPHPTKYCPSSANSGPLVEAERGLCWNAESATECTLEHMGGKYRGRSGW